MPAIEGWRFRNQANPVRLPKSTYQNLALCTSGSLWSQALQFGAGHGGFEAIIFGLLALSTIVAMVVTQMVGPQASGLGGDAAKQMAAFWGTAWYMPVVAGLERAFTITFHIAMPVLVIRAVVRHQAGYLLAAVAAHTAYDAWAVLGSRTLDLLLVEPGLGLIAGSAFWLIVRLKESSPAD